MNLSPDHVTLLGQAYYRYGDVRFGIRLADRLMHLYIIGQTGTGKSTLLANLAHQDARNGIGFCLIDPHGDLAEDLSASLDTAHIYWDVANSSSPYGYNPLMQVKSPYRVLVASGLELRENVLCSLKSFLVRLCRRRHRRTSRCAFTIISKIVYQTFDFRKL